MKRAIVIGASSGIGRELAIVLSQDGFVVGLTGRRIDHLEELRSNLPNPAFCRQMDISDHSRAMELLEDLIDEMGGVDLVVISAGTGFINSDLNWSEEKETIDVNVSGFAAMANVAFRHFVKAGRGHLVGISSIAAIRGSGDAPAYNASKAFLSNYLEGLRISASKAGLPILVTDVKPGFVDTAMAKGEGLFWVAPPQKAARQIHKAIQKKAKHVYITRRWSVIGCLLRVLPDFIYAKL
ncbi:MAG: SDR family NAD(P)-dependent oxidoreductase [Syntrophales bacterium]|nr:SDR family NAD(P)-dependent oxidoreductase [Syntrophales bacterium]